MKPSMKVSSLVTLLGAELGNIARCWPSCSNKLQLWLSPWSRPRLHPKFPAAPIVANNYAESVNWCFIFPRLLDKLAVVCPHGDSCTEVSQRGILEDHLRWKYLMRRVKIFTLAMLGTGARGRWWPASTRGRAAPSGGPTRRCGSTRQTAPSRKRVSTE